MISGVVTALVTPFNQDGSGVDFQTFEKLMLRQKKAGVSGVVACGSTGEAATLGVSEYSTVIQSAAGFADSSFKIIAGVSANSTTEAVRQAEVASKSGAQGLMVVTPAYNKPTQAGLIQHFAEVKRATSLPLMGYNVPGRTGVNLLPNTVSQLASQGILQALKESSGSVDQIMEVITLVPKTFMVLSGDDALGLPLFSVGAQGVVSVLSNLVPKEVVHIYSLTVEGKFEEARKLHYRLLPLMRALFLESNPMPCKKALQLMQLLPNARMRLPLTEASEQTERQLNEVLRLCQ